MSDNLARLKGLIKCPFCHLPINLNDGLGKCCDEGPRYVGNGNMLVNPSLSKNSQSEMKARDRQAKGYLAHDKFPTQIASVRAWLTSTATNRMPNASPADHTGNVALDLGCGPGPYAKILQQHGFSVLAIDFSSESLRENAAQCVGDPPVLYLQEDLNVVRLQEQSADAVVMADVLQHLGGRPQRRKFLDAALKALRPDGCYYLSFFQLNVKHFLRGDVHGSYAGPNIQYERLTVPNVCRDLPSFVVVDRVIPMNIFHNALADSMARWIPFARYLARMAVITGRRIIA